MLGPGKTRTEKKARNKKASKTSMDLVNSVGPCTVHKIEIHLLQICHCLPTRLLLSFPLTLSCTAVSNNNCIEINKTKRLAICKLVIDFHWASRMEELIVPELQDANFAKVVQKDARMFAE